MSKDDILDAVREIEKAVGLDQPLFLRLIDEDDWSFVIKVHALIEAAVTHLLVIASGKNELENIYTFLELSDSRTGKLAFVRELGLLENKYRRFIKTLSELRNKLCTMSRMSASRSMGTSMHSIVNNEGISSSQFLSIQKAR